MKTPLLALIIITVLVIGLGVGIGIGFFWSQSSNDNTNINKVPEANINTATNTNTVTSNYCKTNDDCATAGCSGELCKNRIENVPSPDVSICVYRDWYKCLVMTSCECINNQCQWEKNQEYTSCLEEYK